MPSIFPPQLTVCSSIRNIIYLLQYEADNTSREKLTRIQTLSAHFQTLKQALNFTPRYKLQRKRVKIRENERKKTSNIKKIRKKTSICAGNRTILLHSRRFYDLSFLRSTFALSIFSPLATVNAFFYSPFLLSFFNGMFLSFSLT